MRRDTLVAPYFFCGGGRVGTVDMEFSLSPEMQGMPKLFQACQDGSFAHVQTLLASAEKRHINRQTLSTGATPLMLACASGHAQLISLLIMHGASPSIQNSDGETAFMVACNNGHTECVLAFLQLTQNALNEEEVDVGEDEYEDEDEDVY